MKSEVQKPTFVELEPGTYDALFQGRQGPHPGRYGDFVVWEFAVTVDGEEVTYTGLTSDKFYASRRCKAYRWAHAIDPTLTEETKEWDDVAFVGVTVRIMLDYPSPETPTLLNVKEVLPWAGQRYAPKSAASSPAPKATRRPSVRT